MHTKDIERIQQERHSANHDKLYQATLKEVNNNKLKAKPRPEPTLDELKTSHNNHFLDRQIEMIRKELIIMINEKGGK
jgi:uracil-DNA glycosylase